TLGIFNSLFRISGISVFVISSEFRISGLSESDDCEEQGIPHECSSSQGAFLDCNLADREYVLIPEQGVVHEEDQEQALETAIEDLPAAPSFE
ncbi:hypothetical protein ACJX0J_030185, partial [Zea mays]